jgi:hypothetical protein
LWPRLVGENLDTGSSKRGTFRNTTGAIKIEVITGDTVILAATACGNVWKSRKTVRGSAARAPAIYEDPGRGTWEEDVEEENEVSGDERDGQGSAAGRRTE